MKKLLLTVAIVLGLGGSFHVVSDHYRYEFYDWAIQFEQNQAGLVHREITVNGAPVSFLENEARGSKPTIIMLHGFGASKENWLRFAGKLGDSYHTVALDLSGHGENPRDLSQSYSVEAQVAFLKAFVDVAGYERFHLVGNSMGGAIASLYAATYPEAVITASLISPAGIHEVPSLMEQRLEAGENPLIATTVSEFHDLLDFVMESPPFIPAAVAKVEAEKAVSRVDINRKIFSDLRSDLEKGLDARLKTIQAPVLIMWGDHDRAIHVDNIEKYARLIPLAEKHIFEGIGHLAMVEVPSESAQRTREFIEQAQVRMPASG